MELFKKSVTLKEYIKIRKGLDFKNIDKISITKINSKNFISLTFKSPDLKIPKDYSQNKFIYTRHYKRGF